MAKMSTGQIDQPLEIDRAGPGILNKVQELITRFTSGGIWAKSDDPRRIQAKRLWDKGFGREVGAKNFKAYLASIPAIPEGLLKDDPEFPFLSLADPRVGLVKACSLIDIQHAELGYSEGDVVPFDERHTDPTEPFWFLHDNGRKNRNRRPDECLDECKGDILAGTALTGVFAYLHHPEIVKEDEHVIDLPGSVYRGFRLGCAFLEVWLGQALLLVDRVSRCANPGCGSLRLRRK